MHVISLLLNIDSYWWWCLYNSTNLIQNEGSINFGNQYLIKNGWEADEYREYHSLTDKRITKSDMNLELLKEFEYDTEMRKVDGEDKPQTIYIWKFDNCNKEFNRTWNILDHARMHKGVKPYKCDFCLKQFTQKGNLRKHLKTHLIPSIDQRKRYKWEVCESSYTERYNYKVNCSWCQFDLSNNLLWLIQASFTPFILNNSE